LSPSLAVITPASAGPLIIDTYIEIIDSAAPAGMSSRRNSRGMKLRRAGELIAPTPPCTAVSA